MNSSSENIYRRKPIYAVLLSFVAPGLGHIYSGHLEKGMIIFFLGFILIPVSLLFYLPMEAKTLYPLFIVGLIFSIIIFAYAAVNAWLTAKQAPENYELKPYNVKAIYIAMIIVSLIYPMVFTNHVRGHIIQPFKIPSSSMMPNIQPGDYLLANKTIYQKRRPHSGDIVFFPFPNERHKIFMKRIVGLSGDKITIKNNIVFINGKAVTTFDPESKTYREKGFEKIYSVVWSQELDHPYNLDEITIPTGHCFVLGDNRSKSLDSRQFGPIPLRDLLGKAEYIYKPANSWKRFGYIE